MQCLLISGEELNEVSVCVCVSSVCVSVGREKWELGLVNNSGREGLLASPTTSLLSRETSPGLRRAVMECWKGEQTGPETEAAGQMRSRQRREARKKEQWGTSLCSRYCFIQIGCSIKHPWVDGRCCGCFSDRHRCSACRTLHTYLQLRCQESDERIETPLSSWMKPEIGDY